MAKLHAAERNKLGKGTFALPSKRKYPIPDEAHARSALSYASRSDTEGEYATVRAAVLKKFPGLKTSGKSSSKSKKKSRPKKKSALQPWNKSKS